jgi:hypothetical protein
MVGTANGVNGYAGRLAHVFPEAKMSLSQADPELAAIVEDEKKRQWCVGMAGLRGAVGWDRSQHGRAPCALQEGH